MAGGDLSRAEGYFRFGDTVCYGRRAGGEPAAHLNGNLPDVSAVTDADGSLRLPFNLSEVVTNFRQERYRRTAPHLEKIAGASAPRRLYYMMRPLLPVSVRKHLQKIHLSGWEHIAFPRWPVDVTVESLMQSALALALKNQGMTRIPFVWFWPEGAPACAMVTHDVEGTAGRDFCDQLMDIDESFGTRSAFQIIPEVPSGTSETLLEHVRTRGFEVNLHDLNHDGYLFQNRETFLARAAVINRYARQFQCRGFRSAVMYRRQAWYDAFEFSFDMSVPNVAHLEPQRGGCCTVMPYFIGDILELPLTLAQDYSLFHILGDYSTRLWKQQIDLILRANGLISVITHPDYLIEPRAQAVYRELLAHLSDLRTRQNVWMATPGEIDQWWRSRREMRLVPHGDSWRIEGPGSERASVAYAVLGPDRSVRYELA